MTQAVRVRFAPSPTGPLHIGGLRTALYNYLFDKKHNGDFILRIEDTDQNRFVPGAEDYIVNALKWCNIPFDEGPGTEDKKGPYKQSERKELYKKAVQTLIQKGRAYYAFDSSESLEKHRVSHEEKGKTFIYNWHNRLKLENSLSLSKEEVQKRIDNGDRYVIRFLMVENGGVENFINSTDLIRGTIRVDLNLLDDKILFKSDGMPTYHLANVVDDHAMEISHVIRGEEWLPSLALHHQLYIAFEWKTPQFAHLPLLLKPTGKGKLSKRDGDKLGFPVFPLDWRDPETGKVSPGYKEAGYVPEAVVNFLALLGWNPGTEQEILTLSELIGLFSIEQVHKSGARFDPEKNKWFNQQHLQHIEESVLEEQLIKDAKAFDIVVSPEKAQKVVRLVKERASLLTELWGLSSYFFMDPEGYDAKAVRKQWKEGTPEVLTKFLAFLKSASLSEPSNFQAEFKTWIADESISFGQIMAPLRLCLVGKLSGADLFEIICFLGHKTVTSRIQNALQNI